MPKIATKWKTENGSDTVTVASGELLLETGFNLLLENGGLLLLETSRVTPKSRTAWETPAKNRTSWAQQDGFSVAVVSEIKTRTTAQGDRRVTAQGDIRVTTGVTFRRKNPTEWSEQ